MAKEAKAKKVYVYADGEEGRSAKPTAEVLRFDFATGNSHELRIGDFPEDVQTAAMWHGIAQKAGDEYSGAKTPEDAEEAFLAVVERLKDGDWVTERQAAGPRTSLVFEAIIAAYNDAGTPLPDDRAAAIREELKDNAFRKSVLDKPKIKAQYERLKAEAAIKRAEAAAKAADEAGDDAGLL